MEIDISDPIEEFKNMLKMWPKYDYRRMGIKIDCLSKLDLPMSKLNIVGKRTLKVTTGEDRTRCLVGNIFVV